MNKIMSSVANTLMDTREYLVGLAPLSASLFSPVARPLLEVDSGAVTIILRSSPPARHRANQVNRAGTATKSLNRTRCIYRPTIRSRSAIRNETDFSHSSAPTQANTSRAATSPRP